YCGDAVIDAPIERQIGEELGDLAFGEFARVSHGLSRMHVAKERDRSPYAPDPDDEPIERPEQVLEIGRRWGRDDRLERRARVIELIARHGFDVRARLEREDGIDEGKRGFLAWHGDRIRWEVPADHTLESPRTRS